MAGVVVHMPKIIPGLFAGLKRNAARDGGLPKLFRQNLTTAQWTPVETGATSQGVPDHEYCFPDGDQGWVEFKATAAWAVTIRPEQVGWLLRRHRMGGRCFVAIRRQLSELWIVDGADAGLLKSGGLKAVEPLLISHEPWDWRQVERILRQKRRGPLF
jgi:hypothetical protein